MALNLAYHFAEIDPATGMCIGVLTTSDASLEGPTGLGTIHVAIPVYDGEYLLKYYLNGSWYEDPEGTIPWTSSML